MQRQAVQPFEAETVFFPFRSMTSLEITNKTTLKNLTFVNVKFNSKASLEKLRSIQKQNTGSTEQSSSDRVTIIKR